MIHRKNASSIIEVIVTIVVLTVGIIGAYTIISRGQNLTRTTEKRIQAINIARE
jgi:Tfp pilus assembly protein PilV